MFTPERQDELARKIILQLPYILYFDDFRDSIDERIEIVKDADGDITGWLEIIEQLFHQTDESFSVFTLSTLEERKRKSVLAKVNKRLNMTLTKEWQKFRIDETDALKIAIDYVDEKTAEASRSYLKFEIIETDENDDEHYFYIRDRSKGFFWFFNFVMKLEFNPKVLDTNPANSIYLLDEPGSYLHASAQSKLCMKLRQLSERNKVIYCTHSHYLLDPEHIPLSTIRIADRDNLGKIKLIPIYEFEGSGHETRSAFQPVVDALQIKPFILDLSEQKVIITEGIYDYYAIQMFKGNRDIAVLPSVNANSIPFYISLMIAWRVSFFALWDNDDVGREEYSKAISQFGEEVAKDRFFLLPRGNIRSPNRILQNLFAGDDIRLIKATLELPANYSFDKTLISLFYAQNRTAILKKVSRDTWDNFNDLFSLMGL
jgi:hypothetical protein